MKKIVFLLLISYLFTRLYNLTVLPIFTDESIYIYWAKIISTTHQQLFISLTDGKPPLLVWLIASLLSVLPNSAYLIAGRLPSVLAGIFSLVAVYKISLEMFKSKIGAIVSGLLYIIFPFCLLYDRMALFDSMLSAGLLWTVYFSLKVSEKGKYLYVLFGGITFGLAFLSKPTAIVFIPIILLIMVLSFKKWSLLMGILLISIGELVNNLLRLSHVYYLMEAKNQQFAQPLSKLLENPFELFGGNLLGLVGWIIGYYTWPIFVFGLLAFILLFFKDWKKAAVLFSCWALPIFAFAIVGREIFPRYILFTTPYFLIACGYLIDKKPILLFVLGLLALPLLKVDYYLITNPIKAKIVDTDYHQYVSEHPSGYGLQPIFNILHNEVKSGPVILVTQGTFGLYPYAFNLEFWGEKNMVIVPRWPLSSVDTKVLNLKSKGKVFILLKEYQRFPSDWPMRLVLISSKPPGGEKFPIILSEIK